MVYFPTSLGPKPWFLTSVNYFSRVRGEWDNLIRNPLLNRSHQAVYIEFFPEPFFATTRNNKIF